LTDNCYRCHGKDDVDDGGFGSILDRKGIVESKKLEPGKPDKSRIYLRMTAARGPMPPDGEQPRPSADDFAILKKWIEDGADVVPDAPLAGKRTPVAEVDLLRAIDADLLGLHPNHAKYQRYFSLLVQYNDPAISDADLRLAQAGVSKLLNSLSWKRAIVLPRVLANGALLGIDLRDLDWDRHDVWALLLDVYPYGLKFDRYPEKPGLRQLANSVYRQTEIEVPFLRADWFLATASQPGLAFGGVQPYLERQGDPLYETILRLPKVATDLERKLGVDVADNFLRDKLVRAGMNKSGVSNQNRLIERHESTYGAYWKSYDFKREDERSRLAGFPLGPLDLFDKHSRVRKHPYADQAFQHDGGEIIFNLPNGLQAYYLVNGKEQAIPEGPSEVVRDKEEIAGRGPLIVNGLSCMGCHNHGMKKEFKEEIRDGTGFRGIELDKVRRLYPTPGQMKKLFDSDEKLFLEAMEKACGPYVKVGADKTKAIADFPEPITSFATPFLKRQLTVADGARELGADPKDIQGIIKGSASLRKKLGPWLSDNGTISRRNWETLEGLESPYQELAQQLQLGETKILRK
jgi:serine/threonine-protein kinase